MLDLVHGLDRAVSVAAVGRPVGEPVRRGTRGDGGTTVVMMEALTPNLLRLDDIDVRMLDRIVVTDGVRSRAFVPPWTPVNFPDRRITP